MRNKEELPECPIATTISLVGSKWKLLIIRNLMSRTWRFNELLKSIDGISQKVLTDNLRQLESDGIIYRKDYKTNPPKVEDEMNIVFTEDYRENQLVTSPDEVDSWINRL